MNRIQGGNRRSQSFPYLGFGLGLRPCHYKAIIENCPPIDWFEVITEDFLIEGGAPLYYLDKIRSNYPMALHGVSLSIGSSDPLNRTYLKKLKKLIEFAQPCWVSDHVCWTGVDSVNTHALLPMPFTEEALNHIVERVIQVQDFLGRQILLENISSYVDFSVSEIPEWEFISEISKKSDCFILCDINNIYVNSYNHGFSVDEYLYSLPKDKVKQFHIAGHKNYGTHIIDTHDSEISEEVWDLYEMAVSLFENVSTLIERDDNIPDLSEMMLELDKARFLYNKYYGEAWALV